MSPTQRSLKLLRGQGYLCEVVERFNHFSNTRRDLLGFIDVLALHEKRLRIHSGAIIAPGIVGVQVTGGGNLAARRTKILTERRDQALRWLYCGGGIEIHDWRKVALKRGGKRKVWRPRIVELTLADFGGVFA